MIRILALFSTAALLVACGSSSAEATPSNDDVSENDYTAPFLACETDAALAKDQGDDFVRVHIAHDSTGTVLRTRAEHSVLGKLNPSSGYGGRQLDEYEVLDTTVVRDGSADKTIFTSKTDDLVLTIGRELASPLVHRAEVRFRVASGNTFKFPVNCFGAGTPSGTSAQGRKG